MKKDLHLWGTVLALELPAFSPTPICNQAWGVVTLHASISRAMLCTLCLLVSFSIPKCHMTVWFSPESKSSESDAVLLDLDVFFNALLFLVKLLLAWLACFCSDQVRQYGDMYYLEICTLEPNMVLDCFLLLCFSAWCCMTKETKHNYVAH
jgi:Na+/melibiose symporter-like transporter